MPDATPFAIQWAGLVTQVEMFGRHAPGGKLIEVDEVIGSAVPSVPESSLVNAAVARDHQRAPSDLERLAREFREAGIRKWGLWLDGADEAGAARAQAHGLKLDSTPTPMVAGLRAHPEAAKREPVDLLTVGRINDLAYGLTSPKLEPPIGGLPQDRVLGYQARLDDDGTTAAVAMAYDHGHDDTAVWFVATLAHAQRRGLGRRILTTLLHEAHARGNRTASLQASAAGRPLYESLGFRACGELHLFEQWLS